MKIYAIGGCCKKATQSYENVLLAVKELNLDCEVIHVSDMNEMMKLGVMSTPAIMVDNKLIASGRLLTVEQIKDALKK